MKSEIEFALYLALFAGGCGFSLGYLARGKLQEIQLTRAYHQGKIKGHTESILYSREVPETYTPTPPKRFLCRAK